jgi:hypothetical protein
MQILLCNKRREANLQFEVKAKHISGENNRLPDYLSRWEIDKKYKTLFKNSIKDRICHEIDITQIQNFYSEIVHIMLKPLQKMEETEIQNKNKT